MGLLKAVHGAVGSMLEEQWKEFYCCDSLQDDTLLIRGQKQIGKYSANTRVEDNVLTNGSVICVADGQCVLVVRQGKVVDVCREPGEHVFEDPEQAGVKGFFREVSRRVSYGGGDVQPIVCRVYYLNVKEITGICFETPAPVLFRVKDPVSGLDADTGVLLGGCFSYRVCDPVKLYKTVIGNVGQRFSRDALNDRLQAELTTCLQPALAQLSARGIRPAELPAQVPALCDALREQMNARWCGEHGLELRSLALASCRVTDAPVVQAAQHAQLLRDPVMAAAALTGAAATALPKAAASSAARAASITAAFARRRAQTSWSCVCGAASDRFFCPECGRPCPTTWVCGCGAKNIGDFCSACGKKKPKVP